MQIPDHFVFGQLLLQFFDWLVGFFCFLFDNRFHFLVFFISSMGDFASDLVKERVIETLDQVGMLDISSKVFTLFYGLLTT
ncbi:hypothetical protein L596_030941 [Steinernema carpocapsae]|uniref:Uncharacterized protein n=1 Tax=Steinernema carpocapsae TaxID=34508 RepID=A0A4V5ZZS6_STECR|nr:hypothetical protein L596_030941 [Steinernema carpocapsae]